MILNEERLNEFIRSSNAVAEAAQVSPAKDLHDLVKLHEAANVALTSGLVYRAALDRQESREQFYREDFPESDPAWFCLHGITLTASGMRFDKEEFPKEGVRFQPPPETRSLGAIGVIMSRKDKMEAVS